MIANKKQGLEPLFVKCFAIIVSVVYILSPLRKEASAILYAAVHFIEAPQTIFSHQKSTETSYVYGEKNELKANSHQHNLTDAAIKLLKKTDDSNKPTRTKNFKVDKHVTYYRYIPIDAFLGELYTHKFHFKKQKLAKGFLKKVTDPPEVS